MTNLQDFIPFVKAQAERARYTAHRRQNDPVRSNKSLEAAKQFDRLAQALEEHSCCNDSMGSKHARNTLSLTPSDISGLPPELLEQLAITEKDQQDFRILELFEEEGGTLSLDLVLIGLYRRHGEIWNRSKLNARLYRLSRKGQIFSVPSRKGVYTLDASVAEAPSTPSSEEEEANQDE